MTRRFAFVVCACVAVVQTACADDATSDSTPLVRETIAVDTPRAPMPGDSTCPRDGLWRPCAFVDRISRAGVGIREVGDTVRVPSFTVGGVRYRVGREDTLTVFYYADSVSAKHELTNVDTTFAARADTTRPSEWPPNATFIWNGNVIAILQSTNARQIERLNNAITAGAPYTDPRLR